jgi:ribonuclease Z
MKKGVGLLTAVIFVLALIGFAVYQTESGQDAIFERVATAMLSQTPNPPEGLRVVVCGSASPLGNDPARAQACIAVLTPEHFFLFDTGARSPTRMAAARLPMGRLNGVFFTHFHLDHIASLPDVNLNSWVQGRQQSLRVYGPPGVETVIDGFNQAYGPDRGYRVAHHGTRLLPPDAGPMTPVTIGSGDIAWQDDLMTITAFEVDHRPVAPAAGYRVDYRGRSVVISGDSVAADSLFEAAQGADLLLHDALSRTLLDPMISAAEKSGASNVAQIMTDVIDYHADSLSLEARAEAAGIRQLAFYHLVPVPPNALAEKMFARGLSADTILVKDLHTFDLPTGSTEILISAP